MDQHNPLDDITNSAFIYDALRVAVIMVLILVATYLFCSMFDLEFIR